MTYSNTPHIIFLILFFVGIEHSLSAQASLPVYRTVWNTGDPSGWTSVGTGTYGTECASGASGSSGQIKSTDGYYEVFLAGEPDELTFEFNLEGAQNSSNSFKVQESVNGSTWTTLEEFTDPMPTTCTTKTYSLASTTRYVRWFYDNKASGNIRLDEVNISSPCTYPSTQVSAFSTSSVGHNNMNVSWTRGNGDNVIVVAKKGAAVDGAPSDGVSYTANTSFGLGSEIGTGNFVVYSGTGTSTTVSNLIASETYHFALYEFNTADNCYLKPPLTGSQATLSHAIGDIIITEIMFNPVNENVGEWFEVYNTTASDIDLIGWVIMDNNDNHTIGSSAIVPAGSLAVLEREEGCGAGVYEYGTIVLAVSDNVDLISGGVTIDAVDYSGPGFPTTSDGEAIQLQNESAQNYTTNDNGANWCVATIGCGINSDKGTPGVSNTNTCVLPVELLSFDGSLEDDIAVLKWTTETEVNNESFIIERSVGSSHDFREIGRVAGQAFSTSASNYTYKDISPAQGANYYRLSQVDFDGTWSILKTVLIELEDGTSRYHVYPNPFKNELIIEMADEEILDVSISDISGKEIRSSFVKNEKGATVHFDKTATTGLYILQFKTLRGVEMLKVWSE